jgi:hypothetical protein
MMQGDEFRTKAARMCGSYPRCMGCPLYVAPDDQDADAIPCAYHLKLHTVAADAVVAEWAEKNKEG